MERGAPPLSNREAPSLGLFFEKIIESDPAENRRGKLNAINGSVLAFLGDAPGRYERACILHPHLRAEPFDLKEAAAPNVRFTGSTAMTDSHLFLGAEAHLVRVNTPSVSGPTPFRPEVNIRCFPGGRHRAIPLSGDRLLTSETIADNRVRFCIRDADDPMNGTPMEVEAHSFTVDGRDLFSVGPGKASSFRLLPEEGEMRHRGDGVMEGWLPESAPVVVGNRLYLLAARRTDRSKSLLKFPLDRDGCFMGKAEPVRESDEFLGLQKVENNYMLTTHNAARVYESFHDDRQQTFFMENGMYTPAVPGVHGSVLALPFVNRKDSCSVNAVDGVSGQSIFTTEPFFKIYSVLVRENHLFALVKRDKTSPATLCGYDLKEKRSDDRH